VTSGARDRLFRGYGPLIGFTALFLAIAVLVPSQQREVRIEPTDEAAFTYAEEDIDAEDTAGAQVADAADAQGEVVAADPTVTTSAPVAAPADGPADAVTTGPCADRPLQVPGDPYSPPCIAFSGDNGGATSRGVTAETITVAVRAQGFDNGLLDALSKVAKAKIPSESPEVIARTVEGLVEYFNRAYQFYGRRLDVALYNGKGDVLKEITGGGQEAAEADALKVAQEIRAFADISAVSPVYADGLARRSVVNIGAPFTSREWMSARRPYAWSQFPDCSTIVESVGSYYASKMANRPASFAGGNLKDQPRRLGIIAPENSWYQECVRSGVQIIERSGTRPALNERYRVDVSQMSLQAGEKLAKLKNAGITTVLCGCDPLFLTFLTAKAKEQNYNPEWLVSGVALIDSDLIGSIMEQGQWSRAFGVSFAGPQQRSGQGLGYRAYKAVRNDEPSFGVELIYNQINLLAIGIQMAGPDLNPETFEAGMFRYPARTGPSGTWGFRPGDHTTADDAREVFWNPRGTSIETREAGTYVDPNGGQRFPIGRWPNSPPRVAG
jgi:hypothetical protein